MKKGCKLAFMAVMLFTQVFSQQKVSDTAMRVPMFYASYNFQIPIGDLSDRFGVNSNVGGGFLYKTASGFYLGADFNYIFGKDIRIGDELMSNLKTEAGNIIDLSGNWTSYALFERGYYVRGKFGKLLNFVAPNPNSGIVLMGGAGYLQHKVRIQVENNTAPQLQGDYKRGYDRLTGGICISEFIGYQYLGNSRLVNFMGGFEFVQGWTSPLRDVNFDTGEPDEKQSRFDGLIGFRIAWIIPIYTRMPEEFYYY